MRRALANRFVPVAQVFLAACISVLFFFAASAAHQAVDHSPREPQARILITFLR